MELKNNDYYIDNLKLTDVAGQYGTPLYVYDGNKIEAQYKRLVKAFEGVPFKVKYACKANTNINILKLLKSLGCGQDAVSINEVKIGLQVGFQPQEIMYTPNMVGMDEIHEAVKLGVHINIDSISILEQFGKYYGDKAPVCIRINPHIMAGGNYKISTGHINSKFGISIAKINEVHEIIASTGLKVEGLHFHNGSDIQDADAFIQGLDIMLGEALSFTDTYYKHLEYIDFGSGFKVAYRDNDKALDIEELGRKTVEKFKSFSKEFGKKLTLCCEPGKFIVSEAGLLLGTTNVVKQTGNTVFAGLNTGLNHLIRPMMYEAYHKIVNVSNPSGKESTYTIVGNICETDTFGADRQLNEVREGDILAILNAGAYGFSMSSQYNSRFRPAEVLIYKGKAHLIRKREVFDDLLRNQVEIGL